MKNSYISMKSGPIRTKRIEDCVLKSQLAGGRPGGCIQSAAQELNPWLPRTNTGLNLEPPDFKSSALSDLARRSKIVYLLPLISFPFLFFVSSLNVRYVVNLFSCPGWFSCIITNLHEGPTWPVVTFTDKRTLRSYWLYQLCLEPLIVLVTVNR